jgi:hypothetical protein
VAAEIAPASNFKNQQSSFDNHQSVVGPRGGSTDSDRRLEGIGKYGASSTAVFCGESRSERVAEQAYAIAVPRLFVTTAPSSADAWCDST